MIKKLSIIIPVYNEKDNILLILEKIENVAFPYNIEKEVIIVDDFSNDGTREILNKLEGKYKIIYHEKNKGKGFAIRTTLNEISGDYVIIQDADLEYDPNDYVAMIEKVTKNDLKVLYGSRRLGNNKKYSHLSFFIGGIFLSFLTNVLYKQNITDEPTCYKLIETKLLKSLDLHCERFEFCPEVTAKISKLGYKINEIGVKYYPRSKKEGKKITGIDGFGAIFTLLKYFNWKK